MKKTSNAIYLVYGLLIGVALLGLGLGAASAFRLNQNTASALAVEPSLTSAPFMSSTPSPAQVFALTPTFTSTPTFSGLNPTATETLLPSPTLPAGEQKILNGELALAGPLSKEQQISLYETSIRFVALTTDESIRVGEKFAGEGYGSPTLICGPLSIHILQTAGLVSADNLTPLDFWLLNPFVPKDRALANRVFPLEKYEHHDITMSIRNITFSTFPLYAGDFIYLKHGSGGNFDHMLVVNRVDSMGRAYAVTNYNSDQGFIINEVMLYDPNDPAAGMFMEWTAKRNALKGATGFGGFELWRLRINP